LRVVVTDQVFGGIEIERSLLEPLGVEIVEAPSADEDTLVEFAERADALLVCYATVSARVVEAAARGNCQVISRYGIGVDNIDLDAAARAGIPVTNVPDYCLDEVADHTMALLLAAARELVPAAAGVRQGDWTVPHGRVHRIAGRRLALLGLGRIGRRVAERALPFGLDVVTYDPVIADPPSGTSRALSLEEAVADADYVSLHMPLGPETHHLVDEALIAAMTRAPVLINTSRGGLIDLDAAVRALDDGRLGGLAIDVTEVEPPAPDSPLRSHPRVLLTPHMAFYSAEATDDLQARAADEVVRAFRGEPPRSPVH
jgi:D-3-phosphoglycerate dehydrogenase